MSGRIEWMDLTVANATEVAHFYQQVAGWKIQPLSMGEYDDYCMIPSTETNAVTGICHARGSNQNIPPCWLIYITVDDIAVSLQHCEQQGGKIVSPLRDLGSGIMAIIQDPAGAVCALFQKKS